MKKNTFFLGVFLLILPWILTSCEKVDLSSEMEKQNVKITTRTTTSFSKEDFPISIYALDESGKKVAEQTLNEGDQTLNLKLSPGSYRIVAKNATALGYADVTVASKALSVNITMVQQNARISMTLSGLPEDVKSIGVTVSPIYTTLELNGELSGSGAKSFELKKENDTWTASEVMVYPSAGSTTTFTLTITSDTEQKSYSYVYGKPLERNKPYNFVGNYQGGNDAFDVTGLIYMEDWGEVETVEFDFGPNAEGAQQNVNGHLAITEDLYLSLMEWTDVVSAANEGNPKQAVEIAAEYTEGGLTGWRIPTAEEAKELKNLYGGTKLTSLNEALQTLGGTPLSEVDEKNNTVRYLCEDGLKSFSFANNTTVSNAGAKASYHLRLVRSR